MAQRWGTGFVGKIAAALHEDSRHTTAWKKGAEGERYVGERLDRLVEQGVLVLHDRRIPGSRANIDHIVVSPSGIFIVDAKKYSGTIAKRDVGGWLRTDERLFVAGRDRSHLVNEMDKQVGAVEKVLAKAELAVTEIMPTLCFVGGEFPLFARPFTIRGVTITWSAKLLEAVVKPGPLRPSHVEAIGRELNLRLRAA